MASTPSFAELLVLVLGVSMFAMWVLSDVLEEQLLGRARRERQRAVVHRQRTLARRAIPRKPGVPTLPRARVHQRS